MRKALISAIGVSCAGVAVAIGDIPTRYSGSFPSVGSISNITGTYASNKLTLKGTFVRGSVIRAVSGMFNCTPASSTQTRCAGAFRNEAGKGDRAILTVTWSGGKPVAMSK